MLSLFFAIFALVGLWAAYSFSFKTLMKVHDAKNWVATSCEVISSEVRTSSSHSNGKNSTTYKAEISYRYEFNGQSYKNNAYHLTEFYSSGYNDKRKLVAAYPVALKFTCYVNPLNPNESVIDREPGWYLLFTLFPLPFIAVGLGGLFGNYRNRANEKAYASIAEKSASETMVLKEKMTPLMSFLFVFFICLFWNGCVLLMIYQWIIPTYQDTGSVPILNLLFAGVFVFFGVMILLGMISSFLQLFNPRMSITIYGSRLIPGESYQLAYTITGNAKRLQAFTLTLVSTEKITTITGNKTEMNEETAHEEKIYQQNAPIPQNSTITLSIPENIMPTFMASHNKVVWTLKVEGKIAFWPDMVHEFNIIIYPDIKRVESWLSL